MRSRLSLLFDLRAAQPRSSDMHGAGGYANAVIDALARTGRTDIGAVVDDALPIDDRLLRKAAEAGWSIDHINGVSGLQTLLSEGKPRRFYSALPYEYSRVDFGRTQLIATIHGLRPVEMPADRYAGRFAEGLSEWTKCSLRLIASVPYARWKTRQFESLLRVNACSRRFIVPSEFTKMSLLTHCHNADASEISVLYSPKTDLAADPSAKSFDVSVLGLEAKQYLLMVSTDRWVKNSFRALVAAEKLAEVAGSEFVAWPVVLVGRFPRRFPSRWAKSVRVLGRCDTQTLAGLYANAGLFLYPSLNEGFGYPPVEAMSYGTPVLASAISAIPEISGDGVAYFSPFDPNEIAVRLGSLLANPNARSALADAGARRYSLIERRQESDLKSLCELLLHD